ncbi:MAG: hypothetical protein WCO84_07145, partial [bacterium]
MKSRSMFASGAAAVALTLAVSVDTLAGQTLAPQQGVSSPINLDTSPGFDLGSGGGDPLFTPQLLGLSNGMAGYEQVAAMSACALAAQRAFPPSHEVFLACWGNPTYALLPGSGATTGALASGSPLSLALAFRLPDELVSPARGLVYEAAERTLLSVGAKVFEPLGYGFISPLVLDLDRDGLLSASHGQWRPHPAQLTGPYAAFDMDGDGFKDITEWIGAGDGLLTTTLQPASARDLLGCAGGWRDGFEHLAALFDLDHNGRVEGAELDGLYVWQDLNTNGVADLGEVVPVQSLGITWIAITQTNYVSGYGYLTGLGAGPGTGLVWDWWPNYALANRRSVITPSGGPVLLGQTAVGGLGKKLFDPKKSAVTPPLTEPRQITPAQLAAWGINLPSFRLALLADGGRALIGYAAGSPAPLQAISWETHEIKLSTDSKKLDDAQKKVALPFAQVYQLASDPAGEVVLVLGDSGSKLAVVDFAAGTVTPPDGLNLRSIGLRASGVAGYDGTFWFTAWQLDGQGAVLEERGWALTPWGFWGGLSLDALRSEFGQLRQHYLTGSDSGF